MNNNALERLELNKILSSVADFAVLDGGKAAVLAYTPSDDLSEVRQKLDMTEECDKLLFTYGVGKIERFNDVSSELARACKGSVLSCAELLDCAALLRSARTVYEGITKCEDDLPLVKALIRELYFDNSLECDIFSKIISVDGVSDNASERLYAIRTKIKNLNSQIRDKLAEYSSGKYSEYLQDGIVTIRNDRYVVPVKAEHKNHVKGFVHDRSKTGATFFIEPEYILELNNELIALTVDEREEVRGGVLILW